MQNWKDLFEPHILYRGEDYYEDGRVDDPEHDSGCCTATVHGTQNYEVSIFCSGRTIEAMTCTCPYAREGRNCKHMAALLYFIEREGLLPLKNRKPYQKTPEQLVCSMSENDVRSFLTELAQNDPEIFRQMTYRYASFPAEGLREMLMTEIDAEAKIYKDFYDMDEWEALSRYADSLVSLLLKRLPALQAQSGPRHRPRGSLLPGLRFIRSFSRISVKKREPENNPIPSFEFFCQFSFLTASRAASRSF